MPKRGHKNHLRSYNTKRENEQNNVENQELESNQLTEAGGNERVAGQQQQEEHNKSNHQQQVNNDNVPEQDEDDDDNRPNDDSDDSKDGSDQEDDEQQQHQQQQQQQYQHDPQSNSSGAAGGGGGESDSGSGISATNLIVNYLPQDMTDRELFSLFATCGPINTCKIMRDYKTGYSYGYGFVDFAAKSDSEEAVQKLNGHYVRNKRLKVSYARPGGQSIKDTNLYVINLPRDINEEQLDRMFSPFGCIVQRNILSDKYTGRPRGVAFVRYNKREEAQEAIRVLNNTIPAGGSQPMWVRLAEEHGKAKAAQFMSNMPPMGGPMQPQAPHHLQHMQQQQMAPYQMAQQQQHHQQQQQQHHHHHHQQQQQQQRQQQMRHQHMQQQHMYHQQQQQHHHPQPHHLMHAQMQHHPGGGGGGGGGNNGLQQQQMRGIGVGNGGGGGGGGGGNGGIYHPHLAHRAASHR